MSAAAVLDALAAHGGALLLGVTAVLGLGCAAVAVTRSVAQRRRLGAATAWGLAAYLLLAAVPLPRWWGGPVDAASDAATELPALPPAARAERLRDVFAVLATGGVLDEAAALARGGAPAAPAASAAPVAAPAGPSPVPPRQQHPAAAAPPAARRVLAAVWLLGAALMLLRVAGGWLRLHRLVARCEPWTDAPHVGLPRPARVLVSSRPVRPFCAGVLRPVVVLPAGLLAPARRDEALAVLRHEAAHVRGGDTRLHTLLALLGAVLFFHPLVWWLCRQVRFCGELLADDAAASADGRHHYARALLQLAERAQPPVAVAAAVPVFHRRSEFYRRIQMLLQQKAPLSTPNSRRRSAAHAFATLALVGLAAGTFGVPATAQDPHGRTLRKENAELRETIATLRGELAELRAQIAELGARATTQPAPFEALGRLSNDPDLAATLEQLRRAGQLADGDGAAGPLVATTTPRADTATSPLLEDTLPGQPPSASNLLLGGRPMRGVETTTPAPQSPDAVPRAVPPPQPGFFAPRAGGQPPATPPPPPPPVMPYPGAEAMPPPPPPPVQDPATAPSGGVPLLGDIPTLGFLFHRAHTMPAQHGAEPPPAPPGPVALELSSDPVNGMALGLSATQPPPAFAPAQPQGGAGASALADLTSRYVDLQEELELARIDAAESQQLAAKGLQTQREARRTAAQVRSCERKLAIAKQLIDGEIAATERELAWIDARRKDCSATEALQLDVEASRAKTRLAALGAVR